MPTPLILAPWWRVLLFRQIARYPRGRWFRAKPRELIESWHRAWLFNHAIERERQVRRCV